MWTKPGLGVVKRLGRLRRSEAFSNEANSLIPAKILDISVFMPIWVVWCLRAAGGLQILAMSAWRGGSTGTLPDEAHCSIKMFISTVISGQ